MNSTEKNGVITYLLGAGASANALPVVSNFPGRLKDFLVFLNSIKDDVSARSQKIFDDFYDDIKWTISQISSISIDRFAYELYRKDKTSELNKVKKIIAIYFCIEQIKNPLDHRYESMLRKIWPGKRSELPQESIRILNWNYDFQIEKTLNKLATYSSFFMPTDIQRQCLPSTLPLYDDSVDPNYFRNFNTNKFSIFHLNGLCCLYEYDTHSVHSHQAGTESLPLVNTFDPFTDNNIYGIHNIHEFTINTINTLNGMGFNTHIKFAWENAQENRPPHNINKKVLEKAVESIKNTEKLVVIGYSFPDDNFYTDNKILSAMPKLCEIYFQDPISEQLIRTFELKFVDKKDIQKIPTNDCSQFIVPTI